MRILINSIGTYGDVKPFLCLAERLQQRGDIIQFCTHYNFEEKIKKHNINCSPIPMHSDILSDFAQKKPYFLNTSLEDVALFQKYFKIYYLICWNNAKNFLPDLIIANPPVFIHYAISEMIGCKLQIWFSMPLYPTIYYRHPCMMYGEKFISDINSHKIFNFLFQFGNHPVFNKFLSEIGKLEYSYLKKYDVYQLQIPHVFFYSEELIERPKDWCDHIDIIGPILPLQVAKIDESPENINPFIERHMKSNIKIIYIGFGSMKIVDTFADMIIEFCNQVYDKYKIASIFATKTKLNYKKIKNKNYFLQVSHCCHTLVLPKMLLSIHHGGSGTTHAALQAGIPSLIIPFFGDQFFWGKIIHSKKLGRICEIHSSIKLHELFKNFEKCLIPEISKNARKFKNNIISKDPCKILDKHYKNSSIIIERQTKKLNNNWSTSIFTDQTGILHRDPPTLEYYSELQKGQKGQKGQEWEYSSSLAKMERKKIWKKN